MIESVTCCKAPSTQDQKIARFCFRKTQNFLEIHAFFQKNMLFSKKTPVIFLKKIHSQKEQKMRKFVFFEKHWVF